MQTVCTQIKLLLKEQSDLGMVWPKDFQTISGDDKADTFCCDWCFREMTKQTHFVVIGALGVIEIIYTFQLSSSYKWEIPQISSRLVCAISEKNLQYIELYLKCDMQ